MILHVTCYRDPVLEYSVLFTDQVDYIMIIYMICVISASDGKHKK